MNGAGGAGLTRIAPADTGPRGEAGPGRPPVRPKGEGLHRVTPAAPPP